MRIVTLNSAANDYGVYWTGHRGPFGTPLVFRGTLDQCIEWRKAHQ